MVAIAPPIHLQAAPDIPVAPLARAVVLWHGSKWRRSRGGLRSGPTSRDVTHETSNSWDFTDQLCVFFLKPSNYQQVLPAVTSQIWEFYYSNYIYIYIYIYLALTGSYAWKIRRDSQHGNGTNQNFELDISVRAETMSKSGHPRCLHRNPRAAANATHAAAAAIVRLHSIFRVGRPHRTWVLLELRPNFCAWNGWEVTLRGHMKNSWQKWDDTLYTLDGLNVAMHLLHVGHWRAETSCDQDEPWSWGSKVFAKTSRSRQSSQCIWLPNLESQIHDPIIMDWLALSDI